jgi:hypothetical protein
VSGKSRRRPIRPHERARADQALAATRDYAAKNPDTAVRFVERIGPGTECCWCDCDIESLTLRHDPNCTGCPLDAVYVLHDLRQAMDLPLCDRHIADFMRCDAALHPDSTFSLSTYRDILGS